MTPDGPAIFLSAGEPSGDQHGAAVASALRALMPSVRLFGLGGERMEAAGVELMARLDQLAVMGLGEVLERLPFFVGLRRRVRRKIRSEGIRLVILIDYPGFNLPLARAAHREGRQVLYFIPPQVWAWKERRAKTLAEVCDRVLTVLPFEAELLERYGVRVEFVGHPLLDHAQTPARAADPRIGLFPGSRAQEVELILPVFLETARRLKENHPDLRFEVARAGHLPPDLYADCEFPMSDSERVRRRATVAMTKSGTITLELALAGVPMVVGYRTRPLTYWLAKRLVRVPSISLVNLVAGKPIVPELIQSWLTPELLAGAIEPLLDPASPARAEMARELQRVEELLGEPGCAARVAEHAVQLLA